MIGALLAGITVTAVAAAMIYPLFRPPLEPVGETPGPASRLAALEDRKAAIYGSIRDLGQDLLTDKVTQEDYRIEAEKLKQDAVEVLAEIERLQVDVPRGDESVEERIARIRERIGGEPAADGEEAPTGPAEFCTACGRRAGDDDLFCAGCGDRLRGRA